jgi:hypothetical protein
MAFACSSRSSRFASLSRAAAKYASAVVRRAGAAAVHPDWTARAEICERCPLRVVQGSVSYCGQPMQRKLFRDPVTDGCGCPTWDKAKSPNEHCPITAQHEPAVSTGGACDCKWCA